MYICKHIIYLFLYRFYVLVCKYKILRACESINETMGMWLIRVEICYAMSCYDLTYYATTYAVSWQAMPFYAMLDFSFAIKFGF